ncbi:MAG: hypothetical protein A2660_01605 [Candidatus Doudnabacteria bacterium RIFCSPHIGHO2_01_FULL_45_18]|uniref:DUF5671 domain-containing protein n=1 Tax=Candidatus Doudnabacteria bacterium RIFCSPHIGHO2_01_FULL_45_18 TaxID=1817823 RepID=A0A1F5NPX6_9BACT|nr:MAG: hypothetical protein A2660_01605 [Candidatus Doudnabacteria bacterium RIFCSPHIGHO2_01_FULL_45_18]
MFKQLTDYFFWFAQPSSFLSQQDYQIGFLFLGLLGLAIAFRVAAFRSSHAVNRKLFSRFWNLMLTISLIGLLWFGMRYENTPIFAKRLWAGLTLAIGVIWLGFLIKYLLFNYGREKVDYEREQVKNRYIPGSRK